MSHLHDQGGGKGYGKGMGVHDAHCMTLCKPSAAARGGGGKKRKEGGRREGARESLARNQVCAACAPPLSRALHDILSKPHARYERPRPSPSSPPCSPYLPASPPRRPPLPNSFPPPLNRPAHDTGKLRACHTELVTRQVRARLLSADFFSLSF